MRALAAELFARRPTLRLAALGAAANASALDLAPWGQAAEYLAAERHTALVEQYLAANRYAFPGALALPGWVLSDLYLMPGAIGLLLCPAAELDGPVREKLGLGPDGEGIAAAYVAAPSVRPGLFIGVSLISLLPGIQAGTWIKALTLKMVQARRLRGIAQWANPSLRVHTRMGPLRVVGAVPGTHELHARSFVYESDLGDEARWADAMVRKTTLAPTHRIKSDDLPALSALLARAEAGEEIRLAPPGLDPSGHVLVHAGAAPG